MATKSSLKVTDMCVNPHKHNFNINNAVRLGTKPELHGVSKNVGVRDASRFTR